VYCYGIAVCLEKDQSRIDPDFRKNLHNCTIEEWSPGLPQLQLVGGSDFRGNRAQWGTKWRRGFFA